MQHFNTKKTAMAIAVSVALSLGLAACGGDDDTVATTTTTTTTTTPTTNSWMSASIIAEQAAAKAKGDAAWEAVANKRAKALIAAMTLEQKLQQLTGKRIKPEDFKTVRTVGDVVGATVLYFAARRLFDEYGERLAAFAAPVAERFRADMLVLGGNISRAYPLFGPAMERRLEADGHRIRIGLPARPDHAALIGAASLFI